MRDATVATITATPQLAFCQERQPSETSRTTRRRLLHRAGGVVRVVTAQHIHPAVAAPIPGESQSAVFHQASLQKKTASIMDSDAIVFDAAAAAPAATTAPASAPAPAPATKFNDTTTATTTVHTATAAATAAAVAGAADNDADDEDVTTTRNIFDGGAPIALPMSGGVNHINDDNVAREACAIQDGCQSSAERNIWSVFNPMWSIFDVRKARLPKPSDKGADWAGTVGRLDDLNGFLGLKKNVNRK